MDKIEKIKEWVKKQKKEELARNSIGVITGKALFVDANELLTFLDTLSEEPDTPEFPETFEICLYDGRTPDNEKCTECSTTCSVRKEEPDKSLEEEIKKEMVKLPFFIRGKDQIAFARHFAEWGAEHLRDTTKMIDKSLEEAAEEKYPVYWKNYPKDGIVRSESSYDTNKQCREAFIAGAEWQKGQDDKETADLLTIAHLQGMEQMKGQLLQGSPMPEDTVLFNKGVAEGRRLEREDMLKDAVEGYVNYYEDSGGILMAEAQVGCPYHNGDKVRIVILKEEE